MDEAPRCPHDGQEMRYGVQRIELRYKGESAQVDMPGWYCTVCGEGVHSARDMKVSDRALNRLKARAEHLLAAEDIRRIRRRLGLTQAMAGQLIGGGPKAFSKYETGDLLPSRAVVSALKLLDAMPEGLKVLR